MSPLALKVLMHFYVTPTKLDASDLELGAIEQFLEDGLLQDRHAGDADWDALEITERGKAYCKAILNLPLPVMKWEIPA